MVRGLTRAFDESPVDASLILCIQRQLGPASALQLMEAARPFVGGAVVGLGLAGSEVGNPPADYVKAFEAAAEMGLRKMAHAGEAVIGRGE
jgi:adenosine deaminase